MLVALRSTQTLSLNALVFICIAITWESRLINSLQLQSYTWPITVNSPVATIVGVVEAVSVSKVSCSIAGDAKAQEYFTVGNNTCIVTINKSLATDQNKTTRYFITVQASENGLSPNNNISNSTLEVAINRDLNNPDITNLPSSVNINETSPPGTIIFAGQARDNDSNSQVICEIVPSYPASIYFQIDSTKCEVSIRNSVILDNQPSYQVPIQVYDVNWPNNKVTKNLTVTVNRNLNAPVFNGPATANISNNFPPGDVVLVLTATDADGDRLTFSKDKASSSFYVDSNTGYIYLVKPLSGQANYSFGVQVTDNRNPARNATKTVTINVSNVSFPLSWVNAPYSVNISINAIVNSSVPANVLATKQNILGTMTYRIVGGVPSDAVSYFRIEETTGRLLLSKDLLTSTSMNSRSSVVLFIEAYDNRLSSEVIRSSVTIYFNRNLSPPIFSPSTYVATINDYDPAGTSVITVTATDSDPLEPENSTLYTLDGSRGPTDYFNVNIYTGLITVSKRVSGDPSTKPYYNLTVIAKDPSLEPKSATATITVSVNRNRAPYFVSLPYNPKITDTTDILFPFFSVTTVDLDSNIINSDNGKLDYSIIKDSNTDIRKIFGIDSNGQIYAVQSLRYLPNSTYSFQVMVTDRGVPSLSATASVTVLISTAYAITFIPPTSAWNKLENNTTPSLLETATATNVAGSSNSVILYELLADGFAKQAFNISNTTGVITQIQPFSDDPVKSLSYLLTVRAYRQNDPTVQAYKTIRINVDRNPNKPSFTTSVFSFTIPENQPLGSVFGKINATDADTGMAGEITYAISQVFNTPIASYIFFYVNQYTGEFSLARSMYYESGPSVYMFPVVVKDNGVPQLSASATCSITVLRNINGPIFVPNNTYSITINEDFPVGGALLDLNTTEADNQPVSYYIDRTGINTLYFNITYTSGIISLAESLLRAPGSVFSLTVIASDNQPSVRTAEAYVTVNVQRNPNGPDFLQSLWPKNISEYQEVNVPLLTVFATDLDSPNSESGRVYYSIINQTAISPTPTVGFKTDYFTIGSTSGQIFLSKALTTAESADEYEIYIRAQDGAVTPKFNVSRVVIKIIRDLYRPVFASSNFTASISETKDINSNILSVPAVDNDITVDLNRGTPNAQIVYELRDFLDSNKQSRFFGITEEGFIYKKQATTGDQGSETFSFQVVASDKNWKKNMFSLANVSITVIYVGSASEELGFMQPVYLVAVKENAVVSDANQILYMKVENQENNQVVCTIVGSSDKFVVRAVDNEKNCAIYLISQLDRESRNKYDFNVTVQSKALTETGRKKRQTMFKYNSWISTRVVVEVDDVNNNAPHWVFVPYPKNTSDPPDGTRRTFIAAVDYSSPPDTVAIQLKAIDPDLGLNGEVRYALDVPALNRPPFRIDAVSGDLLTNELPPEDRASRVLPYHVTAVAYDLSVESGGSKNSKAECYVNLIRDENRFVMVINKKSYLEVISLKENYRLALQDASNLVILIERIEAKRYIADSYLQIDLSATDITFVAALPRENYQLINNSDDAADSLLTSMNSLTKIRTAFSASLNTNIETIRPSYGKNVIIRNMLNKSYIWWMDDPWAALIALAAIIILLCIVGVVVITFTYARYIHYISKYRELFNVPSKSKEYEIQTLQMNVPPDDDVSIYEQVKMKFDSSEIKDVTYGDSNKSVTAESWKPAIRNNSKQDKLTML